MILSSAIALGVGLALAAFLVWSNGPAAILGLVLETAPWMPLILVLHAAQVVASAAGWGPLIADPARPGLVRLSLMRWARVSVNALIPVVQAIGEIVRAHLLARAGVAKVRVIASTATDLGTEMASQIVFSLTGLTVLLLIPHAGGGGAAALVLLGIAICAAVTAVFVGAQRFGLFRIVERSLPGLAARVGWNVGGLPGLHDAVVELYRDRAALWRSGGWHMVSWLLGVLETWVALRAIGVPAALGQALVIESLGQAVRSAGFVIPGALGVQEGGTVLICAMFGIPADQAIALVLVRRVRDVISGVPGIVAWRVMLGIRHDATRRPAEEGGVP